MATPAPAAAAADDFNALPAIYPRLMSRANSIRSNHTGTSRFSTATTATLSRKQAGYWNNLLNLAVGLPPTTSPYSSPPPTGFTSSKPNSITSPRQSAAPSPLPGRKDYFGASINQRSASAPVLPLPDLATSPQPDPPASLARRVHTASPAFGSSLLAIRETPARLPLSRILSGGAPTVGTELGAVPEADPSQDDLSSPLPPPSSKLAAPSPTPQTRPSRTQSKWKRLLNRNESDPAFSTKDRIDKRSISAPITIDPDNILGISTVLPQDRPEIKLSIPESPPPTSSTTQQEQPPSPAVPSPTIRSRVFAQYTNLPRPVHPLEREQSNLTSPRTPESEYSPARSWSFNDDADIERRSDNTSNSSFDVLTPDDDAARSPTNVKHDLSSTIPEQIEYEESPLHPMPVDIPLPPPLRPRDPRRLSVLLKDQSWAGPLPLNPRRTSANIVVNKEPEFPSTAVGQMVPGIPYVPERSVRRDLRGSSAVPDLSHLQIDETSSEITQKGSYDPSNTQHLGGSQKVIISNAEATKRRKNIGADAAEAVLYHIFENVDDLPDLFAAARINKGFFNVFKRNELKLMKNTLLLKSSAAWELRESSPKEIIAALESAKSEYTPTRYLQFHTRDVYILTAIKSLMLSRCQSKLRPETLAGLRGLEVERTQMIDDAFWRIWTFCNLFGPSKDGEDQLEMQADWLRGGVKCRQQPQDFSYNAAIFGRGNHGGLTAEELQDMIELWDCMAFLLSGISRPRRIRQAREAGVFARLCVEEGDVKAEVVALDEWVRYLLCLGPSTVLDLAGPANQPDGTVFNIAGDMEWTKWKPLSQGRSRKTFLTGPVTRVREEKAKESLSSGHRASSSIEKAQERSHRLSRSVNLANELRKAANAAVVPLPVPSKPEERPMSLWVDWVNSDEGLANPFEEAQKPPVPPKDARHSRVIASKNFGMAGSSSSSDLTTIPELRRTQSTSSFASSTYSAVEVL